MYVYILIIELYYNVEIHFRCQIEIKLLFLLKEINKFLTIDVWLLNYFLQVSC